MNTKDYLELVADVVNSDIEGDTGKVYRSKHDGSYITRVGMEESVSLLAKHEVTEELSTGTGFSPKSKEWFGWSHRAMGKFGIGTKCEKGDCHYKPANLADTLEDAVRFWSDEYHTNVQAKAVSDSLIEVTWDYTTDVPNKSLRGQISGVEVGYDAHNYGRGEWVAETLEDAKQMAFDFSESVS